MQQENREDVHINDHSNDKEIKLEEIKKASSSSILSNKLSLKEIKKSSSKFESKYADLDSTVNSVVPLSQVDLETKDKSDDETEKEAKNLPEI